MAEFVVHIGMAPSEYKTLTLGERTAILRAARKRRRK
jgi:hypothetical protein